MLREIASLLTTAKGAGAAALLAGTTVTGGAVATVPEVQTAVVERASAVTTTLGNAVAAVAKAANERRAADTSCGKPEQVAQRNEADKQLRDAFHEDHKTLTGLRGGKDADHQKLNAVVKKAQEELRSVLTAALVDVARETQGRTGQVAKANAAASAAASASPAPSASPSPVTFSEALTTTSTDSVRGCDTAAGPKEDVTLNATLAAIVDEAIADMDAIVEKAVTDAGAVPPAERGKPSGDAERTTGNDKDKKDDAQKGKPSEKPGNKPSTPPGRTR
ncbi:MAG TPA: hypothetical protein VFW12_05415 [Candidatus Limnocylindria bacterium]|nr:hypothetical protein [Candidatus Limnocylindria bacterium]